MAKNGQKEAYGCHILKKIVFRNKQMFGFENKKVASKHCKIKIV